MLKTPHLILVAIVHFVLGTGCDSGHFHPERVILPTVNSSPRIPPVLPVPSAAQLEWQRGEMYMFIHFGMNTFTGEEWGDGTEDPKLFSPQSFDPNQWMRIAKNAGFKGVILTAKHHDGFALWPTSTTGHSVSYSDWEAGSGNVVRDVARAASDADLKFGIYLSPWDRHDPRWGSDEYNRVYVEQLRELLTGYGTVFEYWFDGANSTGRDPGYDVHLFYNTVYDLQPDAVIFGGPDIRWVGNESAISNDTQWSAVSDERWHPAECNVRNRPGWFWKESENGFVKTAAKLLEIYHTSVGRNCVLLLNVPPAASGRIHARDEEELFLFKRYLDTIYGVNMGQYGEAHSDDTDESRPGWEAQNILDSKPESFWVAREGMTSGVLDIEFPESISFNRVLLEEPIQFGQRIKSYRLLSWNADISDWEEFDAGTTVGYRKIDRMSRTTTKRIRLEVLDSRGAPAISTLSFHFDSISQE